MKTDYQLLWDNRPTKIPGSVRSYITGRDGGFIRLEIELRYPDGEKFEEVYHSKLALVPGLRIGSKVLLTIKPASQHERQKPDRNGRIQPDKMEADSVQPATEAEFEFAARSFQGSRLESALSQAAQAKSSAEGSELEAQAKVAEYNRKLAALENRKKEIDQEVKQEVEKRIAPEQAKVDQALGNLVSEQRDIENRRLDLRRQEAEIAPYKKAINLPIQEDTQAVDSALPENLATIWPDLLRMSGPAFRSDIAISFLLSVVAATYSGSIVLLNGSVGVGKTSLVNQSAEALGGRCNIIPVRPAWIDPSDLMGFFDPINNTFRPTPFTTALRDTAGNRLKLICLDELNLAKIENYAADLLSCIEYSRSSGGKTREDNDAGKLKLYSKDIEQQLWEEAKDIAESGDQATPQELRRRRVIETLIRHYPSQSPFPANAVLVGTLNSDETTYDLSPKMIDRSYVITFPPANFEPVLEETEKKEHPKQQIAVTKLVEQINKCIGVPAEHWHVVVEWNNKLQGFGIPLGHRVKRDYDVFRATGSVLGLSERDCLGYFLFCKILPRIFFFKAQINADAGTSETQFKNWLKKLKEDYGDFGPVHVIDAMIKMCEDERVSAVRYWSKS